MKRIYKFVAGNSYVTPLGIAAALAVAIFFKHALGWWAAPAYVGVLLVTLAAATCEPIQ